MILIIHKIGCHLWALISNTIPIYGVIIINISAAIGGILIIISWHNFNWIIVTVSNYWKFIIWAFLYMSNVTILCSFHSWILFLFVRILPVPFLRHVFILRLPTMSLLLKGYLIGMMYYFLLQISYCVIRKKCAMILSFGQATYSDGYNPSPFGYHCSLLYTIAGISYRNMYRWYKTSETPMNS